MSKERPGLEGGHICVDFDRTLCTFESGDRGRYGVLHYGAPIPSMVKRVKRWIEEGRKVRIFTARVSHDNSSKRIMEAQDQLTIVRRWCLQHLGKVLPVTCEKNWKTDMIVDDIAVRPLANKGKLKLPKGIEA